MKNPTKFLIEGVDRLGKSTLIKNLQQELGYHLVIHDQKPERLRRYSDLPDPLFLYQWQTYNTMFNLIQEPFSRIIFDRAHLGELVYGPMYRKYDADYVLELESGADTSHARLVLLTTSDFSFVSDDGLSIDFSKKEQEQDHFVHAFRRSTIQDKIIVDVSNGRGGYKDESTILAEVLKK